MVANTAHRMQQIHLNFGIGLGYTRRKLTNLVSGESGCTLEPCFRVHLHTTHPATQRTHPPHRQPERKRAEIIHKAPIVCHVRGKPPTLVSSKVRAEPSSHTQIQWCGQHMHPMHSTVMVLVRIWEASCTCTKAPFSMRRRPWHRAMPYSKEM